MSNQEWTLDRIDQLIGGAFRAPGFRTAVFAGVARTTPTNWVRVSVRPVELKAGIHLQFTYFDGRKTIVRNCIPSENTPILAELLSIGFAGIHVSTDAEEIDIRTTKKGKIGVGRRAAIASQPFVVATHNRIKDLPLPEGRADHVLTTMGISTDDGRIKPTMRAKYTQINEFLKHLHAVLDEVGFRTLGRPVEILDCGCGSSYLTIATHHYLNDILHIPSRLIGIDINDEVIRKSMERADQLGANDLNFTCGKIGSLEMQADVVLALHACDTATDDALAQAIRAQSRLILSVPCCHHHLNRKIRADGAASPLRGVLRHGILRERTADLVTDALRAAALRIMGYRTDVIEFVSSEHTARNLMIRAVRSGPIGDETAIREYLDLRQFWNVTPYIEEVIGESLTSLIGLNRVIEPVSVL